MIIGLCQMLCNCMILSVSEYQVLNQSFAREVFSVRNVFTLQILIELSH